MKLARLGSLAVATVSLSVVACSKNDPPPPAASPVASAAASPPAKPSEPTTTAAQVAAVGPMRNVAAETIPKNVTVAGKLTKAVAWTDKNGDNLAVFSRREASGKKGGESFESAYLDVQHVVLGEPPRVLRNVKDKVENCDFDLSVDFRDAALAVTDIDGDGFGELTFAYSLNCASDMSPAELKLLVLENGDKYILRGSTRIPKMGVDPAVGGDYKVDPSFKSAPPAFLEHAKAAWLKVRAY